MEFSLKLLLAGSFLLFCGAVILLIMMIAKPYYNRRKKDFNGINNPSKNVVGIALCILGALWLLRFAVGLFNIEHKYKDLDQLSVGDQIVNSLLHALMSFSMDEDFTVYILAGIEMIKELTEGSKWMTDAFSVYSAFLNLAAPIAGGAIIFDILAELSPRFHFLISKAAVWREKYYFTALNEQSLSLAKDIVTSKKYHHSTIVFTDAYADDENEESTERLLRAKALGAICLKDDLLHISMNRSRFRTVRVFLSDRKENDNLDVLSRILSWKKRKSFRNLEMYVFSSDRKNDNNQVCFLEDEVTYIYNRMLVEMEERDKPKKDKLTERFEKKKAKIAEKKDSAQKSAMKRANRWYEKKESKKFPVPRVIPINGIRNMAQNLFYRVPLFEGMYGKPEEEKSLKLTLFGSGIIGTEIFLNAYWIGQMLDVMVDVTIVSQETEDEFKSKIDFLNPEILRTLDDQDDILDVRTGNSNGRLPYLKLRYLPLDVMSSDFMKTITSEADKNKLIDSDYFVVALGSDEDNFTVADKLRAAVGYYHMNNPGAGNRKAIINYVIYNSELCRNLNRKCRHDNVVRATDQAEFDVYMHAFGSMDEVYSMSNVMFEGLGNDLENDGEEHNKGVKPALTDFKTWKEISLKYYSHRADIARRLHLYYKAYSAGFVQPTLFCTGSEKEYWAGLEKGKNDFKSFVESAEKEADEILLLHKLSWLEHRRWNAFMRMCGFKYPEDFGRYVLLQNDIHALNDHKFLMLKLHPCLVESDKTGGIHAPLSSSGSIDDNAAVDYSGDLDRLDEISLKRMELGNIPRKAGNDFKIWDYPFGEKFD